MDHKISALAFAPARRVAKYAGPTVWHHFTPLAQKVNAVNLGQGFPGWSPPDFIKKAAVDAVMERDTDYMINQYERSAGRLSLVQALAQRYSKRLGTEVDPLKGVCVTAGASEALACVFQGLLNPGDEVVVFEPAFDIYLAQIEMTGAKPVFVPLRVTTDESGRRRWSFDPEEVKRAFTPRTRMLVLNTPHNPTGKVFTVRELEALAELVKAHERVVVVTDEVYEWLVFDDARHVSIASLPGMFDRTVVISSAGKTFSTTGWKIGWAIGPEHLIQCVATVHQYMLFSVATPLQEAVARALEDADKPYKGKANFYEWLRDEYARKRGLLADALARAGIEPIVPEGSFFIIGDTSKLSVPEKYIKEFAQRDFAFCHYLTVDVGVAAIPPSSFYQEEDRHLAKDFARFAFCKPDDVLVEAGKRFQKLVA